ncbi:MAG: preprotein translocase subunit YidC [Parcubacteria group bacterium Greene0714_21]|nr:MAG: preprotein translocase subunit YidC [Parcubacteria group bacterium Greene0416_39]TSC98346.1 MAG: preprotein translocase subunit YidC [Parcubacteria group bacterium Greene1014_47]TSD03996.1 MAG: preprotein translocase subunit YidC [Parcubacteria group bacterium Greene0714_21]
MGFISDIFHILDQPIVNALTFLYTYLPGQDFGVAVIVLTLLLRLILYPLSAKAFESQKAQMRIQDKVKALQEQYKGQRDEMSRKLLELYRAEKINPFAAILPLLPQLLVLLSLYRVLNGGFGEGQLSLMDPSFFGIVNLSEKFWPFAILAGLSQFIQGKQTLPLQQKEGSKEGTVLHPPKDMSQNIQTKMTYALPLVTVVFALQFSSALSLYWTVSNVFSIVQQWHLMRKSEARNPKSETL